MQNVFGDDNTRSYKTVCDKHHGVPLLGFVSITIITIRLLLLLLSLGCVIVTVGTHVFST